MQLVNVNRIDFVKEQFLFFFGSSFVILAAFVGLIVYPPFRKYRFLGLTFLFTILIFIYLKAKAYYAIGLYPVFLAFGSVYLERITETKKIKFLCPVVLAIPMLLFLPLLQIAFPNHTPKEIRQHEKRYKDFGLLRWEDGKDHDLPQDFADMLGWKELAHKTDSIMETLPDKEYTLLLCDNYGQAGAINYYSTHKNRGAVSMNADYINWFRLDRPIRNVVLVKHIFDKDPERNKEKELFESVECKGEITNPYAREKGTRIFLLKGAKADINQILRDEITERKK